MAIAIITPAHIATNTEYKLTFCYATDQNSGFGFPCDAQGNVDRSQLHPEAIVNLDYCLTSTDVAAQGVRTDSWNYREPAVAKCTCGRMITLDGDDMGECSCPHCGKVYNIFGQELTGFTTPFSGTNEYGERYDEEE